MKTVMVKHPSFRGRVQAYADSEGTVRVWDPVAQYFTLSLAHDLTEGQKRYVRGRSKAVRR